MTFELSTIQEAEGTEPPRLIIMGLRGIGKTSWCAKAESPVFIQTEDGRGKLKLKTFPLCKSFDDIIACLQTLYRDDHDFKTVVLDSLDWAEKLVHEQVRKDHGDDIFTNYGKGYVFAVPYFERLLKAFDAVRSKRRMTVLLTAHTLVKRFQSPDTEPYDRWELDLHQKAASVCEEWADGVLFASQKVYTKSTDVGFNQKQTRGLGTGERILLTEERPAHVAKNRYSLPYELPLDAEQGYRAVEQLIFA